MTLLPIAVRELRVTAARQRTYWTRFFTALPVATLGVFVLLETMDIEPRGFGAQLGFLLLVFLIGQTCFGLAGNTLESVSREKREGTLGFLFLTDLKGYDVAFGKLLSTSLNSFYCLMSVFPVVAIFLLFGGVSLREVWRAALALLNIFFFVHTAALLISTLCQRQITSALIFLLSATSILASVLLAPLLRAGHFGNLATIILILNPFYPLCAACFPELAVITGFVPATVFPDFPTTFYWQSLAAAHLLAWAFFAAASWWLPRCWQQTNGAVRLSWAEHFQRWRHGASPSRTARRARLLSLNPFLWLIRRNRLSQWVLPGALIILSFVIALVFFLNPLAEDAPGIFLVSHLALLIGIGSSVGAQLGAQRRSGLLELILCATPLTVPEILRAQWLALCRTFAIPLIAFLALDSAVVVYVVRVEHDRENPKQFIAFAALAMGLLIVDAVAAGWVAMWRAMLGTKHRRPVDETLSLLVAVPATVLAVIIPLCHRFSPAMFDSFWVIQILSFIIFLAAALVFASVARFRLLTTFHLLSSTQPARPGT